MEIYAQRQNEFEKMKKSYNFKIVDSIEKYYNKEKVKN